MKNRPENSVYTLLALIIALVIAAAFIPFGTKNTNKMTSDISPASITVISTDNATASVGDLQNIFWTSTNYTAPTVTVSVIRKVGDNPARYELVRTISSNKTNNGKAIWIPAPIDAGNDVSIEVGCVLSDNACTGSHTLNPLAVIDNGSSANTASAYQALEQFYNK